MEQIVPVAQWIERRPPEPEALVRSQSGIPASEPQLFVEALFY